MRILIVEDKAENSDLLKRLLCAHCHQFRAVNNGAEALDILRDEAFDLVISDIQIPVINGFHRYRTVKTDERLRYLPFIIYTSTGLHRQADELPPPNAAVDDITDILEVIEGISAHKQATQQLEASEEVYKNIFNSIRDALLIASPDRKIVQCNQAFTDLFGYAEKDIVGRISSLIYDEPDEFAVMGDHIRQNIDNPSFTFIVTYKKKNGDSFRGETGVFYVRNRQGEIVGQIGSIRDVTEREILEQSLRESESKFRDMFHRHGAVKLMIDAETGAIVDANLSAEEFYGWSIEQLRTMAFQDIDTLATAQMTEELQREKMHKQTHSEFRHRLADDRVVDVLVFSSAITNNGKTYLHLIVHDISKRKELEGQLQQAQKMESVGQLAGGVAHDFNNMLSVIVGHGRLALQSAEPGSELQEDLQQIIEAADRSADITRQLLAFSRKQNINPKPIYFNELIEGMLKMLRRLIGENIELIWNPDPGIGTVMVDPAQIDQLMANLCINARDAINGTGTLSIETRTVSFDEDYCALHAGFSPGDQVMLTVSDSGCGMDEATRVRIFEPFFTTKKMGSGTGLGLSTVYGIIKQNKGFINVYSEPNIGTTFRIYLPLLQPAEKEQPVAEDSRLTSGHGQLVLVVEDEPAVLSLVARMLKKLDYQVVTAANAAEAQDLARQHLGQLDLILTDTIMPDMNGRQLVESLQQEYPELKVLYMSGYTEDLIAHQGILLDGVHLLNKPFTQEDLALKIQEALAT